MSKFYLAIFLFLAGASAQAQDTTAPALNKSNRIILHFKDTTGKFMQLDRILIDREYDLEMKDRELGILRTKGPLYGGRSFTDQLVIKTVFRDSTITFSGITYTEAVSFNDNVRYRLTYDVYYSKKPHRNVMLAWDEMLRIAEQLKPAFITYSTANAFEKIQPVEGWQYKRSN